MNSIQFEKDGSRLILQVDNLDCLFVEVVQKYLEKIGLDDTGDLKFFFNSKELSLFDGKSLEENQIYDNAIIQVKGNKTINSETLHIIFVIKDRKHFIEGQSTDKFF